MKKINLRELYPDVYTTDFFVDVTEEVMETIRAAERAEAAYERKMYRYKAQYSLDCENGIENAVLLKPQTPEMLLEEKQFQEQVYAAVMKLPEKQAKRIYARYYLGMTVNASVDPKTVQYLAGHESSKITMDIYAKVKYNRPDELVRSMNCAFASWDAAQ